MSDLSSREKFLGDYLSDFSTSGLHHIIGGERVASSSTFESRTPIDDSLICEVSRGVSADIDSAVSSSRDAFADWSRLDGFVRKDLLHRIADGIESRAEEIALVECWDTGQAWRFMSKAALRGAENFRFFADLAPSARDGSTLPTATHLNYTSRFAIGPVGVITPWNTPFMLSTWKIAPALASGCTVVHKPAELSPLTANILCDICHDAGLPSGVLNVVHGLGEEAGVALTQHPDIRAIAFVGESRTGSQIMKQGADTLKRVHFELGGKNPVIVFPDADLDCALDAVIFMIFSLNGERCTSSSRLLIHESISSEFLSRLVERASKIKIGHPLESSTELGPLIHPDHASKVMSYVELGKSEGAELLCGGEIIEGNYFSPTIFGGATPEMRLSREEVFGPFLTALTFSDDDEAIRIANDVDYGLAGYVWTNDISRALYVSDRLEAGMIWVNSENVRHLPTPFGGVKSSGIGRDGGNFSFDFYMEQKNVALSLGPHQAPRLGAD